jgi:hypothetical protein
MPLAASPGLALVSERPAALAEAIAAIADVYGVAVYPLDLARAEAAVELHRRSAGSGLAVEISAASPARYAMSTRQLARLPRVTATRPISATSPPACGR